jgi:phospholipid-binding lipoprotein MlaA
MYSKVLWRFAAAWVLSSSVALSGCATTASADKGLSTLAQFSRDAYQFNDAVDKTFVKPASELYVKVTPEAIQQSVTSFFNNLSYLNVVVNDLLQAKFKQGSKDIGRFLINTTLGFGGIFDIASRMNLPLHEEDLGQTLCQWGVPEGEYLVLPFLGPSTVRALPDIPLSILTSLFTLANLFGVDIGAEVVVPLAALNAVDIRADLATAIRLRDQALDPYIFQREAYLQRREYLCYDGNPPLEEYEEFDDLDLNP